MATGMRAAGLVLGVHILLVSAAAAGENDRGQQAIDHGVKRLKELQRADGTWPYHSIGGTALAGLTLLECGVPATDRAVRKAADALRPTSINLDDLHTTYSLALMILFFDRLGDARDVPLVQVLAVRLLAGQNPAGGWSYGCPPLGGDEGRRLMALVRQRQQQAEGREPARPAATALPRDVEQLLTRLERQGPAPQDGLDSLLGGAGDNSNTQFALLALWAARRHGIPVARALARTEARFRASQQADGGWAYMPALRDLPELSASTPSMTCAGLLGLAVGRGSAHEAALRTAPAGDTKPDPAGDPGKDPAIRAGLLALGTVIGRPTGDRGEDKAPRQGRDPNVSRDYYFLWSLERVAVAYGLATIGDKDWYAWGSEILVDVQLPDGGWKGAYAPEIDTSFALLFLRRSNLTRDLSVSLQGQVQDPGKVTLEAGPLGGTRRPADPASALSVPKEDGREAARLSTALVRAPAGRQETLLKELQESKGVVYTQALASAIPQLSGDARKKARDALAERLTRMTAATLREKFQDEDLEVRRAAALACAMKEERACVPDLIALLDDTEPPVVQAAHAALKSLSGEDFGPAGGASRAERAQAVAAWKTWWQRQQGGPRPEPGSR